MSSEFELITEEFLAETTAIRSLVNGFSDSKAVDPRARIAAANSATLLMAATFEEYIREMARQYSRYVISSVTDFGALPKTLAATAWRRTLEVLSRIKFDDEMRSNSSHPFGFAHAKFSAVYDFCKGDLTKDIYQDLIHNENNMRPGELNSMFKVAGLNDVCQRVANKSPLMEHFGQSEAGKTHGLLLGKLEDFYERRNTIAHALNARHSSGVSQIADDLDLFECFALSLKETLMSCCADAPN